MENSSTFSAYYIIKEHDNTGRTAHGPYMMEDAETRVGIDEKLISQEEFAALRQRSKSLETDEFPKTEGPPAVQNDMVRDIRGWGALLIVIAIIQIVSSGSLSNTWVIFLIIVGASSFYFRSPAMFVIYGTTLAWAGISNALSGVGGWSLFSILQAIFAVQTFKRFFHYRSELTKNQESPHVFDDNAARLFPWISLITGLGSVAGLVFVFIGTILIIAVGGSESLFGFGEGLAINMAVIGVGAGLASILMNYGRRLLCIIGLVAGALVLLFEIVFFFLF